MIKKLLIFLMLLLPFMVVAQNNQKLDSVILTQDTIKQNVMSINDKVSGIEERSGTSDLPYGTWTFAYSYYFTDNIKFMISYEIPINEKVSNPNQLTSSYTVNGATSKYDYSNKINQNTLTLRMQVKF
jgi:hypothetical protein